MGRDPLSGLIRLEINPSEEERVDDVCALVFQERLPVEIYTGSWDRKLYPFYRCERVMSSQLPNRNTVYEVFKGMGVVG